MLEYKESLSSLLVRELVAFANSTVAKSSLEYVMMEQLLECAIATRCERRSRTWPATVIRQ